MYLLIDFYDKLAYLTIFLFEIFFISKNDP